MKTEFSLKISPVHRCLPPDYRKELHTWLYYNLYPVRNISDESADLLFRNFSSEKNHIFLLDDEAVLSITHSGDLPLFFSTLPGAALVLGSGRLRSEFFFPV